MILTEILSVSIIGFILSVVGLQVIFAMNSQYTLHTTYIPLIPTALLFYKFTVI